MKIETDALRAALARVRAELRDAGFRNQDAVALPDPSAYHDAPTAYARQAARLDAVAEALHELTPMDVELIRGEAAIELASACEEAAKAAYEYFRHNNGDGYTTRWEHLAESAQSLWRTLATRTHDAWEAAAGR